jgi:AMMECR1 domain-containing protein
MTHPSLCAIARQSLVSYLTTKLLPTIDSLGLASHPGASSVSMCFVSLRRQGVIMASGGHVHAVTSNLISEVIESSIGCLQDPRLSQSIATVADLERVSFRVDTFSADRRVVVRDPSEVSVATDGIMIMSKDYTRLSVILPRLIPSATS